ncbi:nitrilase [Roseovarius marisflavi]|uniref:Nitrilase n=1 Tax=Roseovarius marisflavi TaxID=1054996 RepID=A0A1M6XAW5_9RHOB|nr:carbon-nitrogen hydrolase family protein [Roseovarius marisflavi]SHL03094.1 nitrilase [Roseovarius marisflavi]
MTKVAAVQYPPVYYDLAKCLERAVEIIEEAASDGIECLVFSEAWLSGYPILVWNNLPENGFGGLSDIYRRMFENSVDLSKDDLKPVCYAAREHGIVVVIGINERESEMSASTLYNTMVIVDATGEILNVHRKVMPTNPERMVWGFGDASGINVVETAVGRVGGLLCWENYMPLARAAVYAQNVEIYCAPTAAENNVWHAAMQLVGREGSCFVVGVAPTVERSDIPKDLPSYAEYAGDDGWVAGGNGIICDPMGDVIAGPMPQKKGFLTADIDVGQVREARRAFDVMGHYSRPDIFQLSVNKSKLSPVKFEREN